MRTGQCVIKFSLDVSNGYANRCMFIGGIEV
jgi:hypothetical protein